MDLALPTRRRRSRPLIGLLALISITFAAIDQAGNSAPTHPVRAVIRDASASVVSSVDSLWPFGDSHSVKALKAQNASLRAQLDAAQGQLGQAADAEHQRDELTALMNLPTPNNVPRIVASITAIGGSNFDDTIELGKGSAQGIGAGMPVVSDKGLIGRVVQTSRARSTVLLLEDTTSDVGVRFATGDVAVATGTGTNKAISVDLVDLTSQVKPGDVAVTSGEDHSLFPPGIPVGIVTSVGAGGRDLRKNVEMDPIVDIRGLSDVAVLQWKS